MRIATWNVERLKNQKIINEIEQQCKDIDADIFVLTETDTRIQLDYPYVYYSTPPTSTEKCHYKMSERRIAIYSKFPFKQSFDTYDSATAVCVECDTAMGNFGVYGTIMGVYGNRDRSFISDVKKQMSDIRRLSKTNKNIFVCGDFNSSFSDNYYYTKEGRRTVTAAFQECGITIVTSGMSAMIDHIAVSDKLLNDSVIFRFEWNQDKLLSDHKGVMIELI